MSQSISDQDRIERDLERTRSRMDNRLNELQDRLSPGQILDDLMGYFRGSEGGDFAHNLMASVRDNPLPAALTGIGLTWLMASNPRPRVHTVGSRKASSFTTSLTSEAPLWTNSDEFDAHIRNLDQGVSRQPGEDDTSFRSRIDDARGKAFGIARQAQETAASFGQRVQDAVAAARQSVTQRARDLQDSASGAASRIGNSAQGALQSAGDKLSGGSQAAQQLAGNLLSTITDNPVLLGAVGLAVGALLGALVPQSEQEEAALGGMAGQARDTVRTVAQDVVDRGGQASQQVMDAGRDSAAAHGLTGDKSVGTFVDDALSGNLSGNVKQVAQDVLKAADEGLHKAATDKAPAEAPGSSTQPTPQTRTTVTSSLPSS